MESVGGESVCTHGGELKTLGDLLDHYPPVLLRRCPRVILSLPSKGPGILAYGHIRPTVCSGAVLMQQVQLPFSLSTLLPCSS